MTTREAIKALKEGGEWPALAEAIGVVASDPMTSFDALQLGLRYDGIVAEQAALSLYRRTFQPIPDNRRELVTDPGEWKKWIKELGLSTARDSKGPDVSRERDASSAVNTVASSIQSRYAVKERTQFSVFLFNKVNVIERVSKMFKSARVNVLGLACSDAVEHGVLRIVCEQPDRARPVLTALDCPITETTVLGVQIHEGNGSIFDICQRLTAAHVSISYLYCAASNTESEDMVIVKVSDPRLAMKALSSKATAKVVAKRVGKKPRSGAPIERILRG